MNSAHVGGASASAVWLDQWEASRSPHARGVQPCPQRALHTDSCFGLLHSGQHQPVGKVPVGGKGGQARFTLFLLLPLSSATSFRQELAFKKSPEPFCSCTPALCTLSLEPPSELVPESGQPLCAVSARAWL